ncbi:hypothetical protein SRHO_G00088680 [Serrasalmus rhombeus]
MQSMHQPCLLSFRAEEPHPEDEKRKNYGGVLMMTRLLATAHVQVFSKGRQTQLFADSQGTDTRSGQVNSQGQDCSIAEEAVELEFGLNCPFTLT